MENTSIKSCLISGAKIQNYGIRNDYFEYTIQYNHYDYTLRFSGNDQWDDEQAIKAKDKIVLQAMLYNNEWPIEVETIITIELIRKIISWVEYPKTFETKLNYCLYDFYTKRKGKEYKSIELKGTEYLSVYAEDEDEYMRLIKGLQSKKLLEETVVEDNGDARGTHKVDMSERGRIEARIIENKMLPLKPKRFERDNGPVITYIVTKEDAFYGDKLRDFLHDYGIATRGIGYIDSNDSSVIVHNNREALYSSENHYIVFVKSKTSDKRNAFGSLLDIAIEAHSTAGKRNHNYIYLAFVDDSNTNSRPRIDNYYSTSYDFRIIPNRLRLVNDILKDWNRRSSNDNPQAVKSVYNFPILPITEHEKDWLKAVYQKFISNEKFEVRHLLSKMWDNVPQNFEPANMSPLLIRGGTEISLFGIWHIHPESDLFEKFDKVLFYIKDILKNDNEVKDIKSEQILERDTSITHQEIFQIFKLISTSNANLSSGLSSGPELNCGISVDSDVIYKQYRHYEGLEKLMKDLYEREYRHEIPNRIINESKNEKLLNDIDDIKTIDSYKTEIKYKNVKPVMGVIELSKDLSEIIHTLPEEKGQMIGIFGKWGRGKTFLLNELWNHLKENEKIEYIKIEYHAWKYQETPASWAYLYEKFVSEYLGDKKGFSGYLKYYNRLISLNYERLGILPISIFFLAVLTSIALPFLSFHLLRGGRVFSIAVIPIEIIGCFSFLKKLYQEFSVKAIDMVKKYNLRHSYKETLGLQADIQTELIKLLKTWIPESGIGKHKIFLVVEDIDRCTEEKIIQNVDALRVLLEDEEICKRVVIVTAIDERILKNAIKVKYHSILGDGVDINELVSEYLDKLFISAVKLGALTYQQRGEYLQELMEQLEVSMVQKEESLESTDNKVTEKEIFLNIASKDNYTKIEKKEGTAKIEPIEAYTITDSMPNIEYESLLQKRIVEQNKFERLTASEVSILNKVVHTWLNATPRRIKIFYYRYLLCKNILINKYAIESRMNVWQDKEGMEAMMLLILKYTKIHNPDQISLDKSVAESQTENKLPVTINDKIINLYKQDYCNLLEVLELVIAY
ncbi:MAG TPA: P-loop NTPase fold protein [Cytophagaceae bacterium]|nr:P-loop NTPase fold protein [Cytophagaceae bacterium]